MAENTAIEWADHTWNPWEGCQKVGPGCDHCYAETRNARFGGGTAPNWGPGAPRRRTSAANWRKPLQWNADAAAFAEKHGRKQRVFCASLADVFDNAVDPAWRADLFELIDRTPNLDWMLLTKRIGNVSAMLAELRREALPAHVWLGATIVNQGEADRDIPKLLAAPAAVRFLSMEPLLGPVDLEHIYLADPDGDYVALNAATGSGYRYENDDGDLGADPCEYNQIDWVIVGGESGPGARPMHPDSARGLRDQCAGAGVPFFFKQWGDWFPGEIDNGSDGLGWRAYPDVDHDPSADRWEGRWKFDDAIGVGMLRVGKKHAGRLLDGVQHDGFPA